MKTYRDFISSVKVAFPKDERLIQALELRHEEAIEAALKRYQDHIPNTEIIRYFEEKRPHALLQRAQLAEIRAVMYREWQVGVWDDWSRPGKTGG